MYKPKRIVKELVRVSILLSICINYTIIATFTPLWVPPTYNKTVIEAFRSKILINKYSELIVDPYGEKNYNTSHVGFCGVLYNDSKREFYILKNFSTMAEIANSKAYLTHKGACGRCSTLQDLSVYMNYHNLTAPVRKCGIKGFLNKEWNIKCLMKLGLTLPCSQIWFFNSKNTRKKCLKPCLKDWKEPYNVPSESACPNCTLNDCLACDEEISGPIFKKVAARTRRDSGLTSAIWRPPSSIAKITHYYY
jgi:hypothetical protein